MNKYTIRTYENIPTNNKEITLSAGKNGIIESITKNQYPAMLSTVSIRINDLGRLEVLTINSIRQLTRREEQNIAVHGLYKFIRRIGGEDFPGIWLKTGKYHVGEEVL